MRALNGVVISCLLAMLGSDLHAQTDAQNPKFSVRSNLVSLPTRVQAKDGKTIYGLKAEQFIVEDNGVQQTVRLDEAPDSFGLSLVVAVQCSRHAAAEFAKLTGLQYLIENIVGDAPHEVAILSFGNGPLPPGQLLQQPGSTAQGLSEAQALP